MGLIYTAAYSWRWYSQLGIPLLLHPFAQDSALASPALKQGEWRYRVRADLQGLYPVSWVWLPSSAGHSGFFRATVSFSPTLAAGCLPSEASFWRQSLLGQVSPYYSLLWSPATNSLIQSLQMLPSSFQIKNISGLVIRPLLQPLHSATHWSWLWPWRFRCQKHNLKLLCVCVNGVWSWEE